MKQGNTLLALVASVLLVLMGCSEKSYRDRELSLDLRACLGTVEGAMSTCREQITNTVSESSNNACLLFRVVGANGVERIFSNPLNWSEGWLTLQGDLDLPVREGQFIEAELYLFAAGQESPTCEQETLVYGTA